jgi:DUF4097 and DUF4098 domain-containing protein YvlB
MTYMKKFYYTFFVFMTVLWCGCYGLSFPWWGEKQQEEPILKEYAVAPHSTVELCGVQGNVMVKTWNHQKVMIEAVKRGSDDCAKATHIKIGDSPKKITIQTQGTSENTCTIDYTLMLPANTALLNISIQRGSVLIKQAKGNLNIVTGNGDITIKESTASVTAKTFKGTIKLEQSKLPLTESIFLQSLHGKIELALSRHVQAQLTARTGKGSITSDIPIMVTPRKMKLNKENWSKLTSDFRGTLGNGSGAPSAPITIDATEGDILLIPMETL